MKVKDFLGSTPTGLPARELEIRRNDQTYRGIDLFQQFIAVFNESGSFCCRNGRATSCRPWTPATPEELRTTPTPGPGSEDKLHPDGERCDGRIVTLTPGRTVPWNTRRYIVDRTRTVNL